jgi:PTH1 family peptidyl-tRNA hydrolase
MSWLVVGLGNPGNEYSATRHNIGFQVADYLAAQVAGKFSKHKSKAEVLEGRFGVGVDAPKIIIAKPQTYMNDSGKSVVALRNFYQLSNLQIIVIHDELDIDFAKIRVKQGGGDNGHNGLKSLTQSLSGPDYFRVRVGIGRPVGHLDAADFVLQNFSNIEKKSLQDLIIKAGDAVESLMRNGLERTQQDFNE